MESDYNYNFPEKSSIANDIEEDDDQISIKTFKQLDYIITLEGKGNIFTIIIINNPDDNFRNK